MVCCYSDSWLLFGEIRQEINGAFFSIMITISVIVCVFNGEKVISAALNSIKNQTCKSWECIVCDDSSEDGTWRKLEELTHDDERFVLIRNRHNSGPAYARNRCIERARGDYIAIQDADDISLPARLERQVGFLKEHTDIAVLGSYGMLFDEKGRFWGEMRLPQFPSANSWLKGSQMIHASMMVGRRDFIEVGLYDENLRKAEDYDLLTKLVAKGYAVATIPEFLYGVRWDVPDYSRKKLASRWQELEVKRRVSVRLGCPWYFPFYLIKPILAGLIPSPILHVYHKRAFKQAEQRYKTIQDILEQNA